MQTIKAKLLIALTPIVVVALIVAMLFVGASSDDSNTANAATACGVATAPGGGGGGAPAAAGGSSFGGTTFTADQLTVASQIVATLKGLGAAPKAYVLALQTAMQESTLNPKALNGNATGLFQQIAPGPNGPDGKPAYAGYDRTDPVAATGGFWKILQLRVPDYATTNKTNDAIIESIQASGQQEQYVKHQAAAEQTAAALGGVAPGAVAVQCAVPSGGPQPVTATGSQVTVPAIPDAGPLAGKTLNMPSAAIRRGDRQGAVVLGYDVFLGRRHCGRPIEGHHRRRGRRLLRRLQQGRVRLLRSDTVHLGAARRETAPRRSRAVRRRTACGVLPGTTGGPNFFRQSRLNSPRRDPARCHRWHRLHATSAAVRIQRQHRRRL